jgi:hypothetical protein
MVKRHSCLGINRQTRAALSGRGVKHALDPGPGAKLEQCRSTNRLPGTTPPAPVRVHFIPGLPR